ncbi:hypothetical protein LDL08_16830 [Nonomuraea glycinis]|uniref:Uncharacterized protein n=1 Tax=Nonomuraea glycinis TaxID=2047744 RepID=A0A918E697_9ACTN|nr:hypothetical protein [Nonomuraea glycinis]MCA2177857.1 hypothetical protein [Nonomuraea glycinis]GGP06549.1 hypothetical protein GCM10012278_30610 [Nonomuraea glycinis]
MNATLERLREQYGDRWEITQGAIGWYAVRCCWKKCPDPQHGVNHICLGRDVHELAGRLAAAR